MLPKVSGAPVEKLPFDHLHLIADLIYFEGPLLSYFTDNQGQHYLYYWCDVDEVYNRWLIFRATTRMLNQFLTRQVTLRELILAADPNLMFIVDRDIHLHPKAVVKIHPSTLPEQYLPETDSYYDASLSLFHAEQAARDLIVLMQQEAQVTQTKLRRFEQAVTRNPEMFRDALSVP